MSVQARLKKHEQLMTRMAEANGVDLELATQSGELPPEAHRDAVLSCTACKEPDRCEQMLSVGDPGLPDFCQNAAMLERLALRST